MTTKNAVSIITGGGRGIGRSITLRLAQETAVIPVGRNREDLQLVCQRAIEQGGTAEFCVGDVSNPETAAKAVDLATQRGWTIRNLICNAGIAKGGPIVSFDREVWRQMFEVNVHGTFYFIQACLPLMLQAGGGTVCLMSSIAGVHGVKNDMAYCATKHALVGMARSLALEHGKRGIVAVPICPSFVDTEMTRRAIRSLEKRRSISHDEAEKIIAQVNPQERIISPEEVAEAVAVVCSGNIRSLSGNPMILSSGQS